MFTDLSRQSLAGLRLLLVMTVLTGVLYPAAVWAAGRVTNAPTPDDGLYGRVTAAVRGPAGATRVADWQVRDLAPDVVRIELGGLRPKNSARLLRSMARAVADVHGSEPVALAAARRDELTGDEFQAMVHTMVAATKKDWSAYRG